MIPSFFLVLDKFPLTANGKVDRRALPEPDVNILNVERYVAPRTPTEKLLCGIWAEVLGVPRVGIYDNFFDLGGHSLTAIQIAGRLHAATNKEIALHTLFERPVLADFCCAVDRDVRQSQRAAASA